MERRKFVKTLSLNCASVSILGAILQGCATIKYATAPQFINNKIVLNKKEFELIKKDKVTYHQWILVKTEKADFPIGVFRFDDTKYSAIYLECSHQGCEVEPQSDHLQCPCHGSEFSNLGKVQEGPAEKDLKKFEIETDQDNIYILLK